MMGARAKRRLRCLSMNEQRKMDKPSSLVSFSPTTRISLQHKLSTLPTASTASSSLSCRENRESKNRATFARRRQGLLSPPRRIRSSESSARPRLNPSSFFSHRPHHRPPSWLCNHDAFTSRSLLPSRY